MESEKRELEQFKLIVMKRQKLETERENLASQKDQLESKSSSGSANKQIIVAKRQEKQTRLIQDLLSKARTLFVKDKIDNPPNENALF